MSFAAKGLWGLIAARRRKERAGSDIDPQPIRGERHLIRAADRRRSDVDEQLWLLAGLGPPAGADGYARDHRIDRGTCAARRRLRAVQRLRCRRYRDGCSAGGVRRIVFSPPSALSGHLAANAAKRGAASAFPWIRRRDGWTCPS